MVDNELANYVKYLSVINPLIEKFFDQQRPFIHCKEGCSICCESGEYPVSKLEFDYLMLGASTLSQELRAQILEKVLRIKKEKNQTKENPFLYECPFLIDKKCSVYQFRGIICRSYGLISYSVDENDERRNLCPCCTKMGLNYADVYDFDQKTISGKKWEQSGIEAEPVAYNIGLKFLLENDCVKHMNIKFGEQRALIDWFE